MADDTDQQPLDPGSAPDAADRPPSRQVVLDGVYERAAVIRRRRAGWFGIGCGLAVAIAMAGLLAVIPERGSRDVLTADLADNTSSAPVQTTPTLPSTTGTVFATSANTASSDTTVAPKATSVPNEATSIPTAAGSTGVPETTIPGDGVLSITVSPERPKAGDLVTVSVHVVDGDTDLRLCVRDWGAQVTGPSPSCPTKTCGPDDPSAEVGPGSTDRIDRWTHEYVQPGTYTFRVEYSGAECTLHADHHAASVTIEVG